VRGGSNGDSLPEDLHEPAQTIWVKKGRYRTDPPL